MTSELKLVNNSKRQVIKLGLDRIKACLELLDNPHKKFKSVLIGGTNGKGSVTFYLSNLACKFTNSKIGRYISPHLSDWSERFTINEKITDDFILKKNTEEVIKKIKEYEDKANQILTEFEISTIIAFKLFADQKVNIAFLEVGLGGRLDATNVVETEDVLCSVITNVSFDHMDYLGETIEKIAFEKAGIIKEKNHIVCGATGKALKLIENQAKQLNANLIKLNYNSNSYIDKNIETALCVWDLISSKTKINENNINKKELLKSLQFPGRFQYIKEHDILLDGAHNPDGAKELTKLLNKNYPNKKILYIIGMLDKDYKAFVDNLIPQESTIICTEPKSDRATKKEILKEYLNLKGLTCLLASSLKDAIQEARKINNDLILITGSLYLVGEALDLIKKNQIPQVVLK